MIYLIKCIKLKGSLYNLSRNALVFLNDINQIWNQQLQIEHNKFKRLFMRKNKVGQKNQNI